MIEDSEKAKEMQKKSVASRISRNFEVEFQGKEPTRSRETDAGFDLYAREDITLGSGQVVSVSTGTRMRAPKGYYYLILGRSSFNKMGIQCFTGTIDATYTGEVKVCLYNVSSSKYEIAKGDRIAQAVFMPIFSPKLKNVKFFSQEEGDRGDSGWGSSGK